MRNLKRVLSLAMASIMLLGLMVVGVGAKAAGYPDVTSDHHSEAIEVLQTVGIMTGDDDGNFEPDRQLKRDEMAVVMCNLLDLNVKQYGGTNPFTDVPEWAEPYVEACYTNGIISGYSKTFFGAEDVVTTAQASLMLMKALGYFQYQRDFGSDWLLSTVQKGSSIGLYDDVDSNVRGAMTRNDVAQLVLNALESGTVEADVSSVMDINTPGLSVVQGSTKYNLITKDPNRVAYATAISKEQATSIGTNQTGAIVELGEKLFNGDLKKYEDVRDAFGRPADQWVYKSDEIGTYPDKPILTSTKKVTKADMYSLIGKTNIDKLDFNGDGENDLNAYFNGASVTLGNKKAVFDANNTAAVGLGNPDYKRSGLGVLTEVYHDNNNNVDVVLVPTYVAQANGDYDSKSETIRTVTLTNPNGFSLGTLNLEDWPQIKDFKDDDYILYTASEKGGNITLESLELAEIVTGEVNAYSERVKDDGSEKDFGDAGGYVTVDGTQRNYALYAETSLDSGCGVDYSVGDKAAIVVDKDGNVLYVDDASISVGNFLYVDGIVKANGFSGKHMVNAYFADGTNEVITVSKMKDSTGAQMDIGAVASVDDGDRSLISSFGGDNEKNHYYDGWYTYSEGSGGYTLRAASTSASTITKGSPDSDDKVVVDEDKLKFMSGTDAQAALENGVASVGVQDPDPIVQTDITKVRADDDTIFVVVKDEKGTDEVSIYTGADNLPNVKTFTTGGKPTTDGNGVVVSWVNKQDREDKAAGLVFVYVDGKSEVTGGATDTLIYAIKRDSSYTDKKNGEKIERWVVVMNGELTTVDCKVGDQPEPNFAYESYRLNKDGYYEFSDADMIVVQGNAHKLGAGMHDTFQVTMTNSDCASATSDDQTKIINNDYVVYSANTLRIGQTAIRVNSDTQITLIANDKMHSSITGGTNALRQRVPGSGSYVCWTNADKDHEVQNGITAKGVESFLDGRLVAGAAYGIAKSSDSETAERLYIVVTGVSWREDGT